MAHEMDLKAVDFELSDKEMVNGYRREKGQAVGGPGDMCMINPGGCIYCNMLAGDHTLPWQPNSSGKLSVEL